MALGMEVGLGPGHIVLDGTQLPCLIERGTVRLCPLYAVSAIFLLRVWT